MFTRPRYHILTSVALCLLASCAADDSDMPSTGVAMEFYVRDDARLSRADAPAINEFAVFGDMKLTDAPVIIMNNVPVTYNQTEDRWQYSGTQYWFPKHEHSFVATHPLSVSAAGNTPLYSDSKLSFTYTLPADHKQTTDILAATHRRKYVSGTADPILLRFSHVMTQINIAAAMHDNIMSPDAYLKFHKLELSGFRTKATFNISPATILSGNQTDDSQIDVNSHDGNGNLTIDFPNPEKVLNNQQSVSLLSSGEAVIMLPYSFGADSDAKIVLSYTINDDNTSIKQVVLPLMNRKWEPGKSYTYRFTIDRNGPHFEETSIADWDVLDVGNINAH